MRRGWKGKRRGPLRIRFQIAISLPDDDRDEDRVRAARHMLLIMAAAVLWMGLYPKPVTDITDASVAKLLEHVAVSKIK